MSPTIPASNSHNISATIGADAPQFAPHSTTSNSSLTMSQTIPASIAATATPYLEIILGPMFSGKTSKLIALHKQFAFCGVSTVVINHILDDRFDAETDRLTSHDRISVRCIRVQHLADALDPAFAAKVVLINEAQFFDDLETFVTHLLLHDAGIGRKIYVSGLDGDFERKKFGQILQLIPLCDRVHKLHSICAQCRDGTPGIFSMRIGAGPIAADQILVGAAESYIPVCRKCYDIGAASASTIAPEKNNI